MSDNLFMGMIKKATDLAKKNTAQLAETAKKAEVHELITNKAEKTYVDTKVASVASGSPKGTYVTLAALQTAFPTGTTGIYIVTSDGKWYYWNGSAWTAGGIYQSTGMADEIVKFNNLNSDLKNTFDQARTDESKGYSVAKEKFDTFATYTTSYGALANAYQNVPSFNLIKIAFPSICPPGGYTVQVRSYSDFNTILHTTAVTKTTTGNEYIDISLDTINYGSFWIAIIPVDINNKILPRCPDAYSALRRPGTDAVKILSGSSWYSGADNATIPVQFLLSTYTYFAKGLPTLSENLSNLTNKVTSVEDSVNNKVNIEWIVGKYIRGALNSSVPGSLGTDAGYKYSKLIPIKTTGVINIDSYVQGNEYIALVAFYSSDVQSSETCVGYQESKDVNFNGKITIPANAKYMSFCTSTTGYELTAYYSLLDAISDVYKIAAKLTGKKVLDLPKTIYAVKGDTLEIFYADILKVKDPKNYQVVVTTTPLKGKDYARKWLYTPSANDTDFDLKVSVYDEFSSQLLDEQTVRIKVSSKVTTLSTPKNILDVGDSLTEDGNWPIELYRRLTGTNGTPAGDQLTNVNFVGTQFKASNPNVKYEGRGGWTWGSYTSAGEQMYWIIVSAGMKDTTMHQSIWRDSNGNTWAIETIDSQNNKLKMKRANTGQTYTMPASGSLTYVSGGSTSTANIVFSSSSLGTGNPFWNESTNQLDFANYCATNNIPTLDYVLVFLGWNSLLNANVSTNITNGKIFADKLHSQFPNCKLIICGLQNPSRDGWGYNYGTFDGGWIKDYLTVKNAVPALNKAYEDWCLSSGYKDFMVFTHLASQFDSEYLYPTVQMPANQRTAQNISVQSNAIHPSDEGRKSIADVFYRPLVHLLST